MKRSIVLLALCLLLLLAANSGLDQRLEVGIYADEGTQFAIAQSLMFGEIRYLAIKDSTLLFAKGPIFPLLLAIWWQISGTAGTNLDALFLARGLVFLLHALNLCLFYEIIRRRSANVILAGTAALLWALFPLARLLNPLAFSYHFATTLILLSWLFWCHAQKGQRYEDRWQYLVALSFGMALLTDLVVWTMLPGVLVSFRRGRRRKGPQFWAITLSPTFIFVLLQLGVSAEATQMDLRALGSRISVDALTVPLLTLWSNLRHLILGAPWFSLCLLGVWALPRQLRAECFGLAVIPLLCVASTVPITGLAAYHLIPWLPWFALWVATLLVRMVMHPGRQQMTWSWFKALLVVFVAVIWLFSGPEDSFARVSVPPAEASAAAQFLQDRRKPDELVLASPALAWMLPGKAVDFQMALAAEGLSSVHLPRDLAAERFAFDARFAAAQFAVLDHELFRWALVRMPDLIRTIAQIEADWRPIFQTPSLKVYQRASLP